MLRVSKGWVDDGTRTHDTRNHNPMLCQLNYIHHLWDCKDKVFPLKYPNLFPTGSRSAAFRRPGRENGGRERAEKSGSEIFCEIFQNNFAN